MAHIAQEPQILDWRERLTAWREQILDLFFPPRCVNCKRVGANLCADCFAQIVFVTPPWCERCGRRVNVGNTCSSCASQPLQIDAIRAVGYHEGALREAIHALKYNHRPALAQPLGTLLSNWVHEHHWQVDYVIPVPLHRDRERERGYNQAELIARVVSTTGQIPFTNALERTQATQDQIGSDRAARRKNVKDAFRVIDIDVQGKTVLIVDDVTTTGATLEACANALYQVGVPCVLGLAVSRPHWDKPS